MVSTDPIQNLTSRDLVIRVFPPFWQFEAFRILIGYVWYFPLSWLAMCDIFLCPDWPLRLLWFWLYDPQPLERFQFIVGYVFGSLQQAKLRFE